MKRMREYMFAASVCPESSSTTLHLFLVCVLLLFILDTKERLIA